LNSLLLAFFRVPWLYCPQTCIVGRQITEATLSVTRRHKHDKPMSKEERDERDRMAVEGRIADAAPPYDSIPDAHRVDGELVQGDEAPLR